MTFNFSSSVQILVFKTIHFVELNLLGQKSFWKLSPMAWKDLFSLIAVSIPRIFSAIRFGFFSKYTEMKWPGEIRGFTNGEYHTVEDPESIVVKVISSRSLNLSRCYLAPKVHWIRSQFKGASTIAQVTNCIRRN